MNLPFASLLQNWHTATLEWTSEKPAVFCMKVDKRIGLPTVVWKGWGFYDHTPKILPLSQTYLMINRQEDSHRIFTYKRYTKHRPMRQKLSHYPKCPSNHWREIPHFSSLSIVANGAPILPPCYPPALQSNHINPSAKQTVSLLLVHEGCRDQP